MLESTLKENCDVSQINCLTLAFIGDAVFDLLVRENLIFDGNRQIKKLHNLAVEKVCAATQAQAYKIIEPFLSQQELQILKRGRNTEVHHIPKNADRKDYHYATAVEALFGYLYLTGNSERINELFRIIQEGYNEKN